MDMLILGNFIISWTVAFECGGHKDEKMISAGNYQLIFISPESITTNLVWREVLQSETYQKYLVLFAVDEAHCVPKW